ncbi:hypothetical protein QP027_04650 [Corynebacterium breve]|uniref:Uncharacterized protein n=1 Tax=Corynebacterium breve TaxID=3049799 RepID=A0ABY8VGP7_9CORY|nr:hypothetical protein [Corynebacterium breve]WIM68684.1 hypothetical protein QP027_04650 [Corynebacterium breve]
MTKKKISALLAALLLGTTLVACSSDEPADPWQKAKAVNHNRAESGRFPDHPIVLDDPEGYKSSELFFQKSEIAVLVDDTVAAGLRGGSVAMVVHAPMLVYKPDHHKEMLAELDRLGAHTILTVGSVALAPSEGARNVIRDPGGPEALGEFTALQFEEVVVEKAEDAVAAVANVDEATPTWLRAGWAEPFVGKRAEARPVPGQSPRDADMAPKVIATPHSDLVAVVNARSYGAEVTMVSDPNPAKSERTLAQVIGLSDQPLIALGAEFGTAAELSAQIRVGEVDLTVEPNAKPFPSG